MATWSIIAVDRKTGHIGIAGASCTYDVSGIASIVPGKGAIVVQAASDYPARMKGFDLIDKGIASDSILTVIRDIRYNPEKQQYAVIVLAGDQGPGVYTGKETAGWNGEKADVDFVVMGNSLPGPEVIAKAFEAFNENRDKPLAERLMLALRAGEQAGGDKRCGTQYARSAFLMLWEPADGAIHKLAVQGVEKDGKPAVSLLNEQFLAWRSKKNK